MTLVLALALGAHLMALVSLAVLARGNEHARAYGRFVAAVSLWMLLELLQRMGVAASAAAPLSGIIAHFLAVLFLVDRVLPLEPWRRGRAAALTAAAVATLPFTVVESPWHLPVVETGWFVGTWLLVAWRIREALVGPAESEHPLRDESDLSQDSGPGSRRLLVIVALVATPAAVGLMVAIGAVVAIPLLSAAAQAVVLYAMVRLSLYRVRASASRTGALAASAAELDRRAVAGEIAAMVAHEVRNPLTGVRSLAQQMADDSIPDDRRRRYASLIVREVDRVERIVSALLSASAPARRLVAGREETPLARLMEDVALLVSGRARRAGVSVVIESGVHVVAAPPEPLAQILLNLVLNAIAHAPAGTHVRLHASAAGHRARILVEDRGPGVAESARERIWEPFYSGTGGSGLGLAVVKRICDERGWSVEVGSTEGGGATFVVKLPLALSVAAAASSAPPMAHVPTGIAEHDPSDEGFRRGRAAELDAAAPADPGAARAERDDAPELRQS